MLSTCFRAMSQDTIVIPTAQTLTIKKDIVADLSLSQLSTLLTALSSGGITLPDGIESVTVRVKRVKGSITGGYYRINFVNP